MQWNNTEVEWKMWNDSEILLFVLRNSMKENVMEFYLELNKAGLLLAQSVIMCMKRDSKYCSVITVGWHSAPVPNSLIP